MSQRLLQTNLIHARAAQDILLQCLAERGGGLAIAADPYRIPDDHPNWAGDTLGRVAIVSQHARDAPPMLLVESGESFVLVEWGPIDVRRVYSPPSLSRGEYEAALEQAGEAIFRRSPRPIIMGEDFNAHAVAWGSPTTNPRGRLTLELVAGLDLALLNRGRVSTFVGGRGESIVDLTWASPDALDRVRAWRVEAARGAYRSQVDRDGGGLHTRGGASENPPPIGGEEMGPQKTRSGGPRGQPHGVYVG
ncbi:uncharacterized protein LOC105202488 [Solenopsis invicta]|uniref:uncharacterized protein LOC105202488 n=1 Tax=Solenopsis invicta TaxID=13686 RepID=UPI0005961B2D|nr:uncharacterized protein LOC105202488 [Solenopsis invicta]